MRPVIIAAALVLAAAPAFGETRNYDFRTFTKIDVTAGYEVIFTQSAQRSLTIESDDFSKIIAEQKGDTLRIDRPRNTRVRRTRDVVRISAPDLEEAKLSAGVKFEVDGLSVDNLLLDITAGVEARLARLKAQRIQMDVSAAVEVDLSGECGSLVLEAQAGVDVDADDLRCVSVEIDASVGSSVRAKASESVKADAGLGASINISGSPRSVDKRSSLGGSVTVRR